MSALFIPRSGRWQQEVDSQEVADRQQRAREKGMRHVGLRLQRCYYLVRTSKPSKVYFGFLLSSFFTLFTPCSLPYLNTFPSISGTTNR
jgi:hypothetical protein